MTKTVSVVASAFNEEDNLPELFRRLVAVQTLLEQEGMRLEIVLVDDHSTDRTPEIGRKWAKEHPGFKYARLSRNSGGHIADRVGLRLCTGDCAVVIAADLQDPPELVAELVERWRDGNQVVWAVRSEREGEQQATKLFASLYYWLMRRLALPEMPEKGADFLLIDRKVIDACNETTEKNTSYLALILWMGFRQTSIEYVKQARHAGRSKWTWTKKVKLLVDSVVSFSYVPIRLMSVLGISVSSLGFLYAATVILNAFNGHPVEGWSSLMVVVLLLAGFQLLTLGVLGEYLWRSFDETRGRPLYFMEEYVTADSATALTGASPERLELL